MQLRHRKWKRQSPIYVPDGGYGYGIASGGGPVGSGYYPELQHVIHQTPVSGADCDDLLVGRSSIYPALLKSSNAPKSPDSPDSDGVCRSPSAVGYGGGSSDAYGDATNPGSGDMMAMCNCRSRHAATVGCYHHQHRQDCVLVEPVVGVVDAGGTLLRTFGGGCSRPEHVYESASFARAAAAAAAAAAASGGGTRFDLVGIHRHPSASSRPSVGGYHQRTPSQQQSTTAGVYYEVDADAVAGDKGKPHQQLLPQPPQLGRSIPASGR